MPNGTDRIRLLNDELRQQVVTGGAVMTLGIAALGPDAVQRLVQAISTYDDFGSNDNPYGEHEFGAFDFEGMQVMFKIDYYDKDFEFLSPDPSDPAVTERIITVMLAREY